MIMRKYFLLIFGVVLLSSCSENYSNGERIGVITQFSETGLVWKSWEGHLNVTQTGMNSSIPFDFSIDNDNPNQEVIKTLEDEAQYGWKVKLIYHETFGWNWFNNRGETNHFIAKVEVLEKNFGNAFNGRTIEKQNGRIVDTVYVVVVDKSRLK